MTTMSSPLGDALAAEMQRRDTDWKQKDLAAHFDIEQSTASRWLTGKSAIRAEYHQAVADFLRLPIERVAYLSTLRTSVDKSDIGTATITIARDGRPDDPDDEPDPPAAGGDVVEVPREEWEQMKDQVSRIEEAVTLIAAAAGGSRPPNAKEIEQARKLLDDN